MTLEMVKCPHCGYRYRTNVGDILEDGNTAVVRYASSGRKDYSGQKKSRSLFIDLTCPNCTKEFEYWVRS